MLRPIFLAVRSWISGSEKENRITFQNVRGGNRQMKQTFKIKNRKTRLRQKHRRMPAIPRRPMQNPLLLAAEALTGYLGLDRRADKNRRLNEDLLALSGGRKTYVHEYHVRKIYDLLRICLVLVFACSACLVSYLTQDRTISGGRLLRPGYGEPAKSEELSLSYEYEALDHVPVEVNSRKYTSEEVAKLLEAAAAEAEDLLPGENRSTDEVRSPLQMKNTYAGGAVRAEWTTMPYGIVGETGLIEGEPPEEGTLVTVEADFSCQGEHRIFQSAVKVFPPLPDKKTQALKLVEKELGKADELSSREAYLQLPEHVNGQEARWLYARDNTPLILLFLLLSLPFLLNALKDQRIREQAEERRQQLETDYPDLMWKMTLLIGAGMSLSSAFARIAGDYRKEKEKTGIHYVYEEMLQTCNEIRDGVSEGTAYENFGHRCGLPRYIRIGSMLSQSLRKGSKGLASALEQEALSTSQERRSQARKLGEKAGTKLLIPMTMMLCIVLVILVVPAFFSL